MAPEHFEDVLLDPSSIPDHFAMSSTKEWITAKDVDPMVQALFLRQSADVQSIVMRGCEDNPRPGDLSRILIGRIRDAKNTHLTYPVIRPNAKRNARQVLPSTELKKPIHVPPPIQVLPPIQAPTVLLMLRGIAGRASGQNKEWVMTTDLSQFDNVVESVHDFLIIPLEGRGYKVLIFADVQRLQEVELKVVNILRKRFGDRILDVCADHFPVNCTQKSSVYGSLRMATHYYGKMKDEKNLPQFHGIFVVRADVQLKQQVCDSWPLDKLCFFWHTTAMRGNKYCCCDVLFYVPFKAYEMVLQVMIDNVNIADHLHFLSVSPKLTEFVWIQYGLNHPSNTAKNWNPLFSMVDRPDGIQEPGKWADIKLRTSPDYYEKKSAFEKEFESMGLSTEEALAIHVLKLALVMSAVRKSSTVRTYPASERHFVSTLVGDPQTRACVRAYGTQFVFICTYVRSTYVRNRFLVCGCLVDSHFLASCTYVHAYVRDYVRT